MGRYRLWTGAPGEGSLDDWLRCFPRNTAGRRRGYLPLHLHLDICVFLVGEAPVPLTTDQG